MADGSIHLTEDGFVFNQAQVCRKPLNDNDRLQAQNESNILSKFASA